MTFSNVSHSALEFKNRHVGTSSLGIGKSGSDVDHVQKQDQQHISRVLEKSVVRAPPRMSYSKAISLDLEL